MRTGGVANHPYIFTTNMKGDVMNEYKAYLADSIEYHTNRMLDCRKTDNRTVEAFHSGQRKAFRDSLFTYEQMLSETSPLPIKFVE